jgi:photosystem II stability/assembly factor-like uncharacterized protein
MMRNRFGVLTVFATGILLVAVAFLFNSQDSLTPTNKSQIVRKTKRGMTFGKQPGKRPNASFFLQRAYPFDSIPTAKYTSALSFAQNEKNRADASKSAQTPSWALAGPTNIPGRVTDIQSYPTSSGNSNIVWLGSASGGVFKSTDNGSTWTPKFDNVGAWSIGAIALHPTNPNIVFVGTGEANPAFDTYEGGGLYKSTDGGDNWTLLGLQATSRIGRVVISATNNNLMFVAALGKGHGGGNPDRGVYRSLDGGNTWSNVLFVSDTTGCIDVAYFPSTKVVLAAMWERSRYVDLPSNLGGPSSGIYRSADSGNTWSLITSGLPTGANIGRIGLTAEPNTSTAYAIYSNDAGDCIGVFKSTNGGSTWVQVNDATLLSWPINAGWQGGWYFGQIRVAPGNANDLWAMGLDVWRSTDGGNSWFMPTNPNHVDQHALWIDKDNHNRVFNGSDGGGSRFDGTNWTTAADQPTTQFYGITIDPSNPNKLYGGTQDNGSMRSITTATNNWEYLAIGGDGFNCIVDPTDTAIIYAETQNGFMYKSSDYLSFSTCMNGIPYNSDRHAWNTPIAIDPSNSLILYYGSNKLYKTTDGAANWSAISGDLTGGPYPRANFGTISSIAVAPTDGNVIWVGTDDGRVWVTQNGGGLWQHRDATIPDRWVTEVASDPDHANIAYVTLSGYLSASNTAHIYRTENFGVSWVAIDGNLPDVPINDVIPDPIDSLSLYIGTDVGVYESHDLGMTWSILGTGLPIVPVIDMAFHPGARRLVAGTHGRSMWAVTVPCPDPTDTDGDGVGDLCDNCVAVINPFQQDIDNDGIGDTCDVCIDPDNDGFGNPGNPIATCPDDNCPSAYNPLQEDSNDDGIGDSCIFTSVATYDTLPTNCRQLVVGNHGNFGHGGAYGVSLDYAIGEGDCAGVYVYDASPIIIHNGSSPGGNAIDFDIHGTNTWLTSLDGQQSVPAADSGAAWVYKTGRFVTKDKKIAVEKVWYGPDQSDSCNFVIQCLKVYSANGATHTGVTIGEFADFDVPSPSSNNTGGVNALLRTAYQAGTGTGCINNTFRAAGMALLAKRTNAGCVDTAAALYGAYTASNQDAIWNFGIQPDPDVFENLMSAPGYSALATATDQHTMLTYVYNQTLGATDTLWIYTAISTTKTGGAAQFVTNIQKAKKWFAAHLLPACGPVSCCIGIRGNVNGDGGQSINVADIVYLVKYLFAGGPTPPCSLEADANGNNTLNVADVTFLVKYLFASGATPPACP